MQDKITVAFGGRIFSDVKFAEEAFKLILLVDVVIVFEHGEGKALAETARLTDRQIELSDDDKAVLDQKQRILLEHIKDCLLYTSPSPRD